MKEQDSRYFSAARGALVNGETDPELTQVNAQLSDNGAYSCHITTPCGAYLTTEVRVDIEESFEVVGPTDPELCIGDDSSLQVVVTGEDGVGYQWFRNNIPIAGATSALLELIDVSFLDVGTYFCRITGVCQTIDTSPAVVDIALFRGDIQPPVASLGIGVPQFTLMVGCLDPGEYTVDWSADPATNIVENGLTVFLNPPPTENTRLTATIDNTAGRIINVEALVLISTLPIFLDFNGDGCNDFSDL